MRYPNNLTQENRFCKHHYQRWKHRHADEHKEIEKERVSELNECQSYNKSSRQKRKHVKSKKNNKKNKTKKTDTMLYEQILEHVSNENDNENIQSSDSSDELYQPSTSEQKKIDTSKNNKTRRSKINRTKTHEKMQQHSRLNNNKTDLIEYFQMTNPSLLPHKIACLTPHIKNENQNQQVDNGCRKYENMPRFHTHTGGIIAFMSLQGIIYDVKEVYTREGPHQVLQRFVDVFGKNKHTEAILDLTEGVGYDVACGLHKTALSLIKNKKLDPNSKAAKIITPALLNVKHKCLSIINI